MPIYCGNKINLDSLCVRPSATKRTSFRTLQQQYGDGYMARRQDGINPVAYTWEVSTPMMPVEQALELENELIVNGTNPFDWTPPDGTEAQEFILDPVEWEWEWGDSSFAALSFTLKRWYS